MKRYQRGEWLLELKKTYPDLCIELHNALSPGYTFTKHFPKCPIKPGVRIYQGRKNLKFTQIHSQSVAVFNMVSTQPPELLMRTIPGHFAGRWKTVWNFESSDGDQTYKECWQNFLDLYDVND